MYFAAEIDKHAIKVTQDNFPNTIQIGDVTKIKIKSQYENGEQITVIEYDGGSYSIKGRIDLLCGGSPCQGFSFAGKQLNFEDPRSKLFFEYSRILNEINPNYFLLENVKMKKESQDIISKYLMVKPIEINSNLLSAQNRRRLYWTNIPNIEQPTNKGILLKDIVIDGTIEFKLTTEEKINALTASYNGVILTNGVENNQLILNAVNGKKVFVDLSKEPPYTFYESRTDEGKEIRRKIRIETGKDSTPRSKDFKMYQPLKEQKGNCLVTVESPLDYIVDTTWKYRKLLPIEMGRLQTIPDEYTKTVNDRQSRRMIGNGWTVSVISYIFSHLPEEYFVKS